jgi:hypothetical protein
MASSTGLSRKARLVAIGRRNVMRRARQQGGFWTFAAIGWYGARTLSRLAKPNEEVVYSEALRPGEAVTIRHTTESRRDFARRQAAAKAGAKAAKAKGPKSSKRQARRAAKAAAG